MASSPERARFGLEVERVRLLAMAAIASEMSPDTGVCSASTSACACAVCWSIDNSRHMQPGQCSRRAGGRATWFPRLPAGAIADCLDELSRQRGAVER